MEKIPFKNEDGSTVDFYVLGKTMLGGTNYILVTDSDDEEDEDAVALILKEVENPATKESIYTIVDDDDEIDAIVPLFEDEVEDLTLIPDEE